MVRGFTVCVPQKPVRRQALHVDLPPAPHTHHTHHCAGPLQRVTCETHSTDDGPCVLNAQTIFMLERVCEGSSCSPRLVGESVCAPGTTAASPATTARLLTEDIWFHRNLCILPRIGQ